MTVTEHPPVADTAGLYQQVQQFYAQQMQLLDSGRAEEWAETFTEDGVFAANAHPQPARGRATIAAAVRAASDEYAAKGVQRRHWLGMVSLEQCAEDDLHARCYALVIETPRGGQSVIRASTLCEDRLVRRDGRWLVEERQVTRDDLG
ncbi:nuclear transport factor 2 family protein [Streptacidiphilus sp. ASG 303]|uniref:nuclear transport factor 2 family protein n=1 Tax=Streptacidiphilus sp. ASG 303 TaxID=2896847 RepID=UPI001E551D5E|nr:nuclear transport factor 2 family protein [Streptacidiphilus sp. ASG 303]MCD0485158.1 nuclear transport factor 2 family protein [Streptacidiphilus sp. ASG 303]